MRSITSKLAAAALVVAASAASASACMPSPHGWVQPSPYGGFVRCSPQVYMQNDPYRVVGPYAGAGSARVMQGFGVPAPIAGWTGGRIQENYNAAHRERNVQDAIIRGQTGISMRDIRQHGLAGGPNSEIRKIGRMFGL